MPNVYLSNFIRLNTWKDFVIDYASDYMTNPPGHAGVKSHMLIGDKLYYGINKIRTDRTQSTKILNVQYNHSSI
jgi:hypothetical protein